MSASQCHKILNSTLGKDLTEDDCAVLASIITFKQLSNEAVLFASGEATHTLYVILNGKIDVTKDTSPTEWLHIHTLQPGDLAGEMGFIDGEPHSMTLRAHGETELFCIQRTDLEKLLLTHPHVVYHVMRAITRATHKSLRRMNEQFIELNRFINNEYTTNY